MYYTLLSIHGFLRFVSFGLPEFLFERWTYSQRNAVIMGLPTGNNMDILLDFKRNSYDFTSTTYFVYIYLNLLFEI